MANHKNPPPSYDDIIKSIPSEFKGQRRYVPALLARLGWARGPVTKTDGLVAVEAQQTGLTAKQRTAVAKAEERAARAEGAATELRAALAEAKLRVAQAEKTATKLRAAGAMESASELRVALIEADAARHAAEIRAIRAEGTAEGLRVALAGAEGTAEELRDNLAAAKADRFAAEIRAIRAEGEMTVAKIRLESAWAEAGAIMAKIESQVIKAEAKAETETERLTAVKSFKAESDRLAVAIMEKGLAPPMEDDGVSATRVEQAALLEWLAEWEHVRP